MSVITTDRGALAAGPILTCRSVATERIPSNRPSRAPSDLALLSTLLAGTHQRPDEAAVQLMERFPTFQHAVQADAAELAPLVGVSAATVLKGVVPAASRLTREALLAPRETISGWTKAKAYFGVHLNGRRSEAVMVLYLDRKNRLISESIFEGTVDRAPLYPREIARQALLLDATAVLMAHNHPTGNTTPSDSDIDVTRMLQTALKAIDCILHDHLIFGQGEPYSFQGSGRLG